MKKVPIARIAVETPYLFGEAEAQCLPDAIYNLIIGNVPSVRPADDPDPTWQEACAVTTRAQSKKERNSTPMKVQSSRERPVVERDTLVKMQFDDDRLKNYGHQEDIVVKGGNPS